MPTYQYACNDCGHAFEQHQKFTDDALTVCPECGGRLRKIYNAVGVVFKGSGFYRTDSRSSDGASSKAASNGSSSNGTSKDSASEKSSSDSPATSGSSDGTKAGGSKDGASASTKATAGS